jgi:hypothetical protein
VKAGIVRIGNGVAVAAVLRRPAAAQMHGRGGRLQHGRKNDSGSRKQQQKACDQTLHDVPGTNPKCSQHSPQKKGGARKALQRDDTSGYYFAGCHPNARALANLKWCFFMAKEWTDFT